MPIDPNIALSVKPPQFESPLNQLAQVLQIQGMQRQNELGGMQLDQTRRSVEEQNALRRLLGEQGFDITNPEMQRRAMAVSPTGAQSLIKANMESQKTGAEVASKRTETAIKKAGLYRDALAGVSNPQQAAQWLQSQYQDADLKGIFPMPFEQAAANIPQDPEGFQQWVQKQALGMGKFIEQNAPKTNIVNTGGQTQIVQTPGLGGAPRLAGSLQNTQSPDSAARLRQEQLNANQGISVQPDENGRLVAVPTKVAPGAPVVGRPVVNADGQQIVGKGAAPTEFQGKSAIYGARADEADKILTDLTGKYSPLAVNMKQGAGNIWAVGGAAEAAGNLMLSKEAQRAEQAMRDFVNAILRQESGAVISEQEFANAQRQYFPQPGDTPETIQQKARNRQIAIEGIKRNAGKAAFSPTATQQESVKLPNGFTFLGVEQ